MDISSDYYVNFGIVKKDWKPPEGPGLIEIESPEEVKREDLPPDVDMERVKSFLRGTLKPYKKLFHKYDDSIEYITLKCIAWELLRLPVNMDPNYVKILRENYIKQLMDKIYHKVINSTNEIDGFFTKRTNLFYLMYDYFQKYTLKNISKSAFRFPIGQRDLLDLEFFIRPTGAVDPENINHMKLFFAKYFNEFTDPFLDAVKNLPDPTPKFIPIIHAKKEKIITISKNITRLVITLVLGKFVNNLEEKIPNLTLLKGKNFRRVVIFPQMKVMKNKMFELYKLTNHAGPIKEYYGPNFGAYSTYIFGLFGFCLKRGIGLCRRFLKLSLVYVGFIDPCLWPAISSKAMEEPPTYDRFTEPLKPRPLEAGTYKPGEIFKAWINNNDVYENVDRKMRLFCESFIDTLDFLPADFQEQSYKFSNYRNKVGDAMRDLTNQLFDNNSPNRMHNNIRGGGGFQEMDSEMPLIVKYLWEEGKRSESKYFGMQEEITPPRGPAGPTFNVQYTQFPDPTPERTVIDEIREGFTYFDMYKMSSELLYLLEKKYNFSPKKKIRREQEEVWGVGFEDFDFIVKKRLRINKDVDVDGRYKDVLTLMLQLNESQNLSMILEQLYKNHIRDTTWKFSDPREFDKIFENVFVKNRHVMMTVIMICNIRHEVEEMYQSSMVKALMVINTSDFDEKVQNCKEGVVGSVECFCKEVMLVLYKHSVYRVEPIVFEYQYYVVVNVILRWFMRTVFEILRLWDDGEVNRRRKSQKDEFRKWEGAGPGGLEEGPPDPREQLKESRKRVDDLEKMLGDCKDNYSRLIGDFTKSEEDLGKRINDIKGLSKNNEQLVIQKLQLEKYLQDCQKKSQELELRYRASLDIFEPRIEELLNSLENCKEREKRLKSEKRKIISSTRNINRRYIREINKLTGEKQQLINENVNLKRGLNELNQRLTDCLNRLQEKDVEIQRLLGNLVDFTSLQSDLINCKQELNECRADKVNLKRQFELKEEELRECIEKLSQVRPTLQAQVDEAVSKIQERLLIEFTKKKEEVERKLGDLNRKLIEKEEQIRLLENNSKRQLEENKGLEETIENNMQKITDLTKRLDEVRRDLSEMRDGLSKCEMEKKELEAMMNEQTSTFKELEDELRNCKNTLMQSQQTVEMQINEIRNMKNQVEKLEKERLEATEISESGVDVINKLNDDLRKCRQDLQQSQATVSMQINEIRNMKNQVEKLEEENIVSQRNLTEKVNQLKKCQSEFRLKSTQLNNLHGMHEAYKKDATKKEEELVKKYLTETKDLKGEIVTLRASYDSLNNTYKNLKRELQEQIGGSTAPEILYILNNLKEKLEDSYQRYLDRTSLYQTENNRLKNELKKCLSDLDLKNQRLNDCLRKIDQLEENLQYWVEREKIGEKRRPPFELRKKIKRKKVDPLIEQVQPTLPSPYQPFQPFLTEPLPEVTPFPLIKQYPIYEKEEFGEEEEFGEKLDVSGLWKEEETSSQPTTAVSLYHDFEEIWYEGETLKITNAEKLTRLFPMFLKWNDTKIMQVWTFGDEPTYLAEDLFPMGMLMLFRTFFGFSNKTLYQGNPKTFRYNIPRDLLIRKSLTIKRGMEKIFSRTQLQKLRPAFNQLVNASAYYLTLMTKRRMSRDMRIYKSVNELVKWGKRFSRIFLNQQITPSWRYSIVSPPPNSYFNDTMYKIQKVLRIIWTEFKKIFDSINLNNRKMYFKFINMCFDISSTHSKIFLKTDVVAQIISLQKLSKVYWVTNVELVTYMKQFQEYHKKFGNYLVYLDDLETEPTFLVILSLIMIAEKKKMIPLVFATNEFAEDAFRKYKRILEEINLLRYVDILQGTGIEDIPLIQRVRDPHPMDYVRISDL